MHIAADLKTETLLNNLSSLSYHNKIKFLHTQVIFYDVYLKILYCSLTHFTICQFPRSPHCSLYVFHCPNTENLLDNQ